MHGSQTISSTAVYKHNSQKMESVFYPSNIVFIAQNLRFLCYRV